MLCSIQIGLPKNEWPWQINNVDQIQDDFIL